MTQEALKLALEALRKIAEMRPREEDSTHGPRLRCRHCGFAWRQGKAEVHSVGCAYVTAHNAIKEALAQPECARCKDLEEQAYDLLGQLKVANLKWSVAHPWVGLTDEERLEIRKRKWWDWEDAFDIDGFMQAVETKLKEKNT